MNFLPQVSPENLDERYFERGNFTMHENACQIKLHLEADVDIGSIDGRRPPESESSVGNLIQT